MTTFNTSREIAAPIDQVFSAFSDPERLARWWGPDGFTNTFGVFEFKPGGRWSYTMHSPNGGSPQNESVFEEIALNKIVIRHLSQPLYRLTIHLIPTATGTLLSWSLVFDDDAVAARIEKIVVPANEQNLDRLMSELSLEPQKEPCFYHGTKTDLKPGDTLSGGFSSNYTDRKSPWIYFSGTLHAATWGAELAKGEGRERIYVVEPTGPFVDDPNVTDKKFPGNPTKSYRSKDSLRVVSELLDWVGHDPKDIQTMKEFIKDKEPIDD